MTINSKAKGKLGELEFSRILKDHGITARRGVQYAGGTDSPDVVHDLLGIHFEVKRSEKFQPYMALAQAEADRRDDEIPVVAHRPSRKEWIAVMSMEDFLWLAKKALK